MSRITKLTLSVTLGIVFSLASIGATIADDKGHGGKGGHGGHGGGGGGGHNFFGFGPGGFTYGYHDDNFGLLIGPVGGRAAQPYYGAPAYDPGYASPPISYAEPIYNGYGNGTVISSSAAPINNPNVSAPVPANPNAYSGEPGSLAESFYRQSVEAFQKGEYSQASRFVDHAIVEDSASGVLRVYASQCLLASSEFEASAAALNDGLQNLPQSQWGSEVKNFRDLYKRNDYVTHIKHLEKFAAAKPEAAYANALCAYHFFYLGHADAARRHLDAARKANPEDPLVALLAPVLAPVAPSETPTSPPTAQAETSILIPSK